MNASPDCWNFLILKLATVQAPFADDSVLKASAALVVIQSAAAAAEAVGCDTLTSMVNGSPAVPPEAESRAFWTFDTLSCHACWEKKRSFGGWTCHSGNHAMDHLALLGFRWESLRETTQ